MKGLPFSIQIKLLESDPTPNLPTMVSFTQCCHALDELLAGPTASCAAVHHTAIDHAVPQPESRLVLEDLPQQPHKQQQQQLDTLQRLVSNMADQQADLIAAVSTLSTGATSPSPLTFGTYPARKDTLCFYCHDEGHIVWNCSRRVDAHCFTEFRGCGTAPRTVLTFTIKTVIIINKFVSFRIL